MYRVMSNISLRILCISVFVGLFCGVRWRRWRTGGRGSHHGEGKNLRFVSVCARREGRREEGTEWVSFVARGAKSEEGKRGKKQERLKQSGGKKLGTMQVGEIMIYHKTKLREGVTFPRILFMC